MSDEPLKAKQNKLVMSSGDTITIDDWDDSKLQAIRSGEFLRLGDVWINGAQVTQILPADQISDQRELSQIVDGLLKELPPDQLFDRLYAQDTYYGWRREARVRARSQFSLYCRDLNDADGQVVAGSVTSAAELPPVGAAHRYVVVGVLETTRRLVLALADEPGRN